MKASTMDDLARLRPAGQDSVSIRSAIGKAEAAATELTQCANDLDRKRLSSLLTATEGEIDRIEREAELTRRSAERVTALIASLGIELAAAQRRERTAALQQQIEEAHQKGDAWLAWLRDDYPRHAMAIRDGLRLEAEALAARERAAEALRRASDLPTDTLPPLAHPNGEAFGPAQWGWTMGEGVQLPAPDGTISAQGAIWWPANLMRARFPAPTPRSFAAEPASSAFPMQSISKSGGVSIEQEGTGGVTVTVDA